MLYVGMKLMKTTKIQLFIEFYVCMYAYFDSFVRNICIDSYAKG